MNHKTKIEKAIEAAKELIHGVAEPIKWMAEAQPGKVNAIFLAGAINDDQGEGVTFNGTVLGDAPSIVAALVGAIEANPEIAELFAIALNEWQNKPCNCPACMASRNENIKNQN